MAGVAFDEIDWHFPDSPFFPALDHGPETLPAGLSPGKQDPWFVNSPPAPVPSSPSAKAPPRGCELDGYAHAGLREPQNTLPQMGAHARSLPLAGAPLLASAADSPARPADDSDPPQYLSMSPAVGSWAPPPHPEAYRHASSERRADFLPHEWPCRVFVESHVPDRRGRSLDAQASRQASDLFPDNGLPRAAVGGPFPMAPSANPFPSSARGCHAFLGAVEGPVPLFLEGRDPAGNAQVFPFPAAHSYSPTSTDVASIQSPDGGAGALIASPLVAAHSLATSGAGRSESSPHDAPAGRAAQSYRRFSDMDPPAAVFTNPSTIQQGGPGGALAAQWVHGGSPVTSKCTKSKRRRLNSVMNEVCATVSHKDDKGKVVAVSQVMGVREVSQRKPYPEKRRQEIARTRKLGACERCKRLKISCSRPEGSESRYLPCDKCMRSKPFFIKLPCFLAKPVEAELFRRRPSVRHPLETSRTEVYKLEDIEVPQREYLELCLTQDSGEMLKVFVTRYEPQLGEKTDHRWKGPSGKSGVIEMEPFCIARMEHARQSMLEYIQSFRTKYLCYFGARTNRITNAIFEQARRFSVFNNKSIVSMAIDLFTACRIIERDWRICGEETLGMAVLRDDPDNPWFDKIPITPIMDTQLDQVVIQEFLTPLREELLQELQEKIYNPRRENWFEIFLTICILLTNAELLLDHSRQNAIRYGAKHRYNSITRAELYFHSCKIMIAHFHYVCNGFAPLRLDWRSRDAASISNLDGEQLCFMEQLKGQVKAKENELLALREENQYESELYWCHQLFFENWTPGKPDIVDP